MISKAEACALKERACALLASRRLRPRDLAVFDQMLFRARRFGAAVAEVSYSQLQAATGLCRQSISNALRTLREAGLIAAEARRVLVVLPDGGRIWKQLTNVYRFARLALARGRRRESTDQTDSKQSKNLIIRHLVDAVPAAARGAQRALADIARQREQALWSRAGEGPAIFDQPHQVRLPRPQK